jgi:WD40 repeat protein
MFNVEDIQAEVKQIKFSYDNKTILLGTDVNELTLIDAMDGHKLNKFSSQTCSIGPGCEVGFTPDSRYILSGSKEGRLIFWNVATGREIALKEFHPKPLKVCKFSWTYTLFVTGC